MFRKEMYRDLWMLGVREGFLDKEAWRPTLAMSLGNPPMPPFHPLHHWVSARVALKACKEAP